MEAVVLRRFEHIEVYVRILMPGETDETQLAGFFGILEGLHRAARSEDAVGIFKADHFVKLHQVHMVGLKALERFVDLLRRRWLRPAIDLRHEKDLLAIPVP